MLNLSLYISIGVLIYVTQDTISLFPFPSSHNPFYAKSMPSIIHCNHLSQFGLIAGIREGCLAMVRQGKGLRDDSGGNERGNVGLWIPFDLLANPLESSTCRYFDKKGGDGRGYRQVLSTTRASAIPF